MIVRTFDTTLIKAAVTHPHNWRWASDDYCDSDTYAPCVDNVVYWLEYVHEGEHMGVYLVHPHNAILCEIHTCLTPNARGKIAKIAANEVLSWIFENTSFAKVMTHVPINNPLARAYAHRAGMKDEGINRQSIQIGGELMDQFSLGITKKEFTCQQQSRQQSP